MRRRRGGASNEPDHLRARARVEAILTRRGEIVVPALFPIEVTSALVRRAGWPLRKIDDYVRSSWRRLAEWSKISLKNALGGFANCRRDPAARS